MSAFNLGDYLKNNPNALTTKDGKVVIKIPLGMLIKMMEDGMDERAKRVVKIKADGDNIVIEFDASAVLGNFGMNLGIPR